MFVLLYGRSGNNTYLVETITYPEIVLFLYNVELSSSPNANKIKYQVFANGLALWYNYNWDTGIREVHKGRLGSGSTYSAPQIVDERNHTYIYDSNWMLEAERDALGNNTTYTRDSLGRVISKTDPRGGVEEWTYDDMGNILTYTGKLDNITAYQYHPVFKTKVVKVTSPAPFNYETTFSYDSATGLLLSKTDRSGKTTVYAYYTDEDGGSRRGLLKEVADPNGVKTSFGYDIYGNLTSITDGLGKTTTLTIDSLGRQTAITDPMGNTTRFEYDVMGNAVKTIDQEGNATTTKYDGIGRVISTTNPLNNSVTRKYDLASNIVEIINSSGEKTEMFYDVFGNMSEVSDALERVIKFDYDLIDRITGITDPMGRVTTYEYDPYCGTTTKIDPKGQEKTVTSNLLCKPIKTEYQDGYFAYAYDELGRIVSITPDGQKFGDGKYGGAQVFGSGSYGGFDYGSEKFFYGFDPADVIRYTYDPADRIKSIQLIGNLTVYYDYDDAGKLTRLTDVNGIITDYEYYDNNLLKKVKYGNNEALFKYDDAGRLTEYTYPNGIVKAVGYDEDSRLESLEYKLGAKVLLKFVFGYDKTGNITTRTVTRSNGISNTFGYVYDDKSQLIRVTKDGRMVSQYTYDALGNRLLKEYIPQGAQLNGMDSAVGYMKVIYDYNANNEIQSANGDVFGFDLNGNMVSKYVPGAGEVGYLWNSADKLVGVDFPDGSFARFFYRHDGLRYRRVDSDGSETLYFWGAGSIPPLLAERRGAGAVMPGAGGVKNSPQNGETPAWLSYPPGLNAIITSSGEITYRLTDHLGSIFAITDEKGNIITQYDYDEFGIPIPPPSSGAGVTGAAGIFNTAGTGFAGKTSLTSTAGYTGEPQLTEPAGLVYLRQRYYDPEMGRFVSRDPITDIPRYTYVLNNPMILVDPWGTEEVSVDGNDPGFIYDNISELFVSSSHDQAIKNEFIAIRDSLKALFPAPDLWGDYIECSTYASKLKYFEKRLKKVSGASSVKFYIRKNSAGHYYTYLQFNYKTWYGSEIKEPEWWFVEANGRLGDRFFPFVINQNSNHEPPTPQY